MTFRNASALALIALLAGCAGSSSTPALLRASGAQASAPLTMRQFVHSRVRGASSAAVQTQIAGWMRIDETDNEDEDADDGTLSARHRPLLYVSDIANPTSQSAPGVVKVYAGVLPSEPLHLVGTIAGLDSPSRVAIDRYRHVFVVQTDFDAPVRVFKRGATQPYRSLRTAGELPTSIAVAHDGTVYVGTTSTILVYAPGSNVPTTHLDGDFGDGINELMIDRDGNLYVDYVVIGVGGIIGRFHHGAGALTQIPFPDSPLNAALLEDGDMAIAPFGGSTIDRFERAHTTLAGSFPVVFLQSFGLNRAQSALYAAGAGSITTYAFPAGTALRTLTFGTTDANFGVAASPASRLPQSF